MARINFVVVSALGLILCACGQSASPSPLNNALSGLSGPVLTNPLVPNPSPTSGATESVSLRVPQLLLGLTAAAAQPAPTPLPAQPPSTANQRTLVDFRDPQINATWAKALQALKEGRLVGPAGANAVEHYLDVKNRLAATATPTQVALAQEAVKDLLPYVLWSADVAVERHDTPEATRLIRLAAAIDPQAPALARLVDAVRLQTNAPTPAVP